MKRAVLALVLACGCVDADEVRQEFCQGRPFFCDGGYVYPDAGLGDDSGVPDAGSPGDAGSTGDAGSPDAGDGGP
jgi:hypothetical protein